MQGFRSSHRSIKNKAGRFASPGNLRYKTNILASVKYDIMPASGYCLSQLIYHDVAHSGIFPYKQLRLWYNVRRRTLYVLIYIPYRVREPALGVSCFWSVSLLDMRPTPMV